MDGTIGTPNFKPEKNLVVVVVLFLFCFVFFQEKNGVPEMPILVSLSDLL